MSFDIPEKFESIATLAAEGSHSRTEIYGALNSGKLSAFKKGRRTLIKRSDWEAFKAASARTLVPYTPATKTRVAANVVSAAA